MQKANSKLWTSNFALVILTQFLVFLNHIMILSTFPFYIESLGGSEAISGLAATLFSLIAVICRPFVGWMLDNGKRRVVLFAGLCGMALMPVGYLCISVVFLAFVCRMVHGASLALSNTSTSTIATDIIPRERFAEGMGLFGTAIALATSCAPACGLFLKDELGFTGLFLVATGVAVVALILVMFLKVPKVEVEHKPLSFKGLLDKDAMPASVIMLVFLFTFGALENFMAKFASENELPSGGVFFAIVAVMLFVIRATIGKVADRRGEGIFVYTCNAAMFIALLLLAFVPSTVTFVLAAMLVGYGFGGLEPALQSMAVHIAPLDRRGAANSTFLCAYDIGMGLGGGIAGVLISSLGYSQMFAILTLSNIISVLLYHFWGRKHPSAFAYGK